MKMIVTIQPIFINLKKLNLTFSTFFIWPILSLNSCLLLHHLDKALMFLRIKSVIQLGIQSIQIRFLNRMSILIYLLLNTVTIRYCFYSKGTSTFIGNKSMFFTS